MSEKRIHSALGLLAIFSFVLLSLFLSVSRQEFWTLLGCYTALFASFGGMFWLLSREGSVSDSRSMIYIILSIGLFLRLSMLTAVPNLSQDFFRFIWDGHQLLNGYNLYVYLPNEVVSSVHHIPNASFLHVSMGELSASNYTNYPPLNQLMFMLCAFLGNNDLLATVVWMRILLIVGDVVAFFALVKLLVHFKRSPVWSVLYWLNPFVLIELTGNLHWEGWMTAATLWGIYFVLKEKWWPTAVAFAAGILIKLVPLMLLPLLFRRFTFWRFILVCVSVFVLVFIGYAPFLDSDFIAKYTSSIGLWFGTFEFNGSVYAIVRELGFYFKGYNIIGVASKWFSAITVIAVLFMAVLKSNTNDKLWIGNLFVCLFVYLILATTVHPWYLTLALSLSLFVKNKVLLLWSFVVFFSYSSYADNPALTFPFIFIQYSFLALYLLSYVILAQKHHK
jgi:hypothetical protein